MKGRKAITFGPAKDLRLNTAVAQETPAKPSRHRLAEDGRPPASYTSRVKLELVWELDLEPNC